MTRPESAHRPLVILTGPPASRGFGISTHIRMLKASTLADRFELEHVELGGESWSSSSPRRAKRILAQLSHFRGTVRRRRPSLVHINTAPDTKAFLRDAVALRLVPQRTTGTVLEFHGGFGKRTVLNGAGPLRSFAAGSLRRASSIITLDQFHSDALERLCPGLQNVRAIPNFLEPEMMSALGDVANGAAGGTLRLLFMGRVAREKGVFDAIEATRMLREKGIDVMLAVAGTGDDLEEAKALAASHDLGGAVEFLGYVAGAEKVKAYGASDVLLFPTYWDEGFPYVLLEAMAAGLPIISTTYGVMPSLVRDGVNGYLVAPRDQQALAEKVETFVRNPGLLAEMGKGNRLLVEERYGVEAAAKAYGDLYDELLKQR
jgi:glycosyltransferase involved in cell wall biosynthesis